MSGAPQPGTSLPAGIGSGVDPSAPQPTNGNHVFEGPELDAALQLLAERAQYITGATGAALALYQGEEMVCRASVGSGPAVGARLQIRSGLTGESISRKQLLRCDNAETDGRVNIETCRQLGIASIVVAPLLSRSGEVRGLFELFSDHAYAFEERDLVALERMADLTLTALDLAEKPKVPVVAPQVAQAPEPTVDVSLSNTSLSEPPHTDSEPETIEAAGSEIAHPAPLILEKSGPAQVATTISASDGPLGSAGIHSTLQQEESPPSSAPVPDAMLRVQKCASCGFPVSECRTLCLDCENKNSDPSESGEALPVDFVPAFLADSPPPDESWLANHVNLLAVLVLLLSIAVAVVVFR